MAVFKNLSFRGKEKYNEIKDMLDILEFLRKEEEEKQSSPLYKLRTLFSKKKNPFKNQDEIDLILASDLYFLYYTEDKKLIGDLVHRWHIKYAQVIQLLPLTKRFVDTYYPDIAGTYDLASTKSIPQTVKDKLKLDGIDVDGITKPKKDPTPKIDPKPTPAPKRVDQDQSAKFQAVETLLENLANNPTLDRKSIDNTLFKQLQFLYFASTVIVYRDFIIKICEKYKHIIAEMPETKEFIAKKYLDIRFDKPVKNTPKPELTIPTNNQPATNEAPIVKQEEPKPHTEPMITSEEKKDIPEETSQPKIVIPDDIEPARSLATEAISKYFLKLDQEDLSREEIEDLDNKIAAQIYVMPIMSNHLSCIVFLNKICEKYKNLLYLLPATQLTIELLSNPKFAANIPNSFGYQFSPTSDGGVKMSVYIPSNDDSTDDSSPV